MTEQEFAKKGYVAALANSGRTELEYVQRRMQGELVLIANSKCGHVRKIGLNERLD